eukprot:4792759-Pyramimonas_sp.AAC.1
MLRPPRARLPPGRYGSRWSSSRHRREPFQATRVDEAVEYDLVSLVREDHIWDALRLLWNVLLGSEGG